ncbi:hypothetical protein KM043_006030 [Ampulex compressa]|nr:hypothetical protein KM043_006030 [Ampulex compressa]
MLIIEDTEPAGNPVLKDAGSASPWATAGVNRLVQEWSTSMGAWVVVLPVVCKLVAVLVEAVEEVAMAEGEIQVCRPVARLAEVERVDAEFAAVN